MRTRPVLTWIALLGGEACLAALTIGVFWYQDWRYSLPTPRPAALVQPELGSLISLDELVRDSSRPVWLHFFNPNCPCSQFNLDHVRNVIAQFGDRVQVVAVLEATAPVHLETWAKFHLNCPAVVDEGGAIAKRAGVYATPQGVVLDEHRRLYYRGNYNLARYCTAEETEFVRLAIEGCLAHQPAGSLPTAASVAVGCELPANRLLAKESRP